MPDDATATATNDAAASGLPLGAGRLALGRTCRLLIGGRFRGSESGRYYAVTTPDGQQLATAARASRKDLRDAVCAARAAVGPWSALSGYRRGQLLYQIAELLDGRRGQLITETLTSGASLGEPAATDPAALVDAAIDRWLWYVGWADKIGQVLGAVNPVGGPYTTRSVVEPTGVVGIVAPHGDLLSLVSVVAPVIVSGNAAVVLTSERQPLLASTFGELVAASDLPSGVLNLLSGPIGELGPWLAGHLDMNAVDLTGVEDPKLAATLEEVAAENLKRVVTPRFTQEDWTSPEGIDRMAAFCEIKTIWNSSSL